MRGNEKTSVFVSVQIARWSRSSIKWNVTRIHSTQLNFLHTRATLTMTLSGCFIHKCQPCLLKQICFFLCHLYRVYQFLCQISHPPTFCICHLSFHTSKIISVKRALLHKSSENKNGLQTGFVFSSFVSSSFLLSSCDVFKSKCTNE